jgi:hypothetical protein
MTSAPLTSAANTPTRPATAPRDADLVGRVGAALLIAAGIIHVAWSPEYLDEHPFYGVLFLLSLPLALVISWWLWQRPERVGSERRRTAWLAGLALALGMAASFVLSRTVGLPGMSESEWSEGLPSLLVELAFTAVAAYALTGIPADDA